MFRMIALSTATITMVSGCIEVPELEAAVTDEAEKAEAPQLLPIGIATATTTEPRLDGSEAEVLSGRAQSLQARAQGVGVPASDEDLDAKSRLLNQRADDLRNR